MYNTLFFCNSNNSFRAKVTKSERGMPRLLEAMKDVVSCDKLRVFANKT